MLNGEEIDVLDGRELKILTIPIKDIEALLRVADKYIGCFWHLGEGNFWGFNDKYRKRTLQEVNDALEVRERSLVSRLFGRPKKYKYLGRDAIFAIAEKLHEKVFKENSPPGLEYIVGSVDRPGIIILNKRLEELEREIGIFLRYFFSTTLNQTAYQRYLEAIMPVEERRSVMFGAYTETNVKSFKFSAREVGASQSESINLVPVPLTTAQIDFYVGKIIEAAMVYRSELVSFASLFGDLPEGLKVPEHLRIDVEIFNDSLRHIQQEPYSIKTGFYAIRFGTALRRIKAETDRSVKLLYDSAQKLIIEGHGPSSVGVLTDLLTREGFSVKYQKGLLKAAIRNVE